MNLTTQHLYKAGLEQPSPAFVQERAAAEARLGVKLRKFFTGSPRVSEYDALIQENCRLRKAVEEARLALARAFGDESP